MSSSCYKIDFKSKVIEIYNKKGVGELLTSLQAFLKDWSDFKIIIKTNESKTDL
jgi:hypothetical protein